MTRSDKRSGGGGNGGGSLALTGITPDSGLLEDGMTHFGVIGSILKTTAGAIGLALLLASPAGAASIEITPGATPAAPPGAAVANVRGDADGDRLIIRGGSAGGFTTLLALTTRDVFKAGASYYGLSELEAFVNDTHKFESRYLFTLIGPYPERKDLYYERSAINHVDKLSVPMIMFQGLEDKIVPPNQAELMLEALREKGLPVAYVPFEGEQHGFRKAENIKRALDAELYFYSRVFGFALADAVEPVEIENLD